MIRMFDPISDLNEETHPKFFYTGRWKWGGGEGGGGAVGGAYNWGSL